MTGRVFVDSNILIYAHDADAGKKQSLAAERLKQLWEDGAGRLSTQVLQEFYVTVTQKIGKPLSKSLAREVVRHYSQWVHSPIAPATILRASEISEVSNISFWDAMIVASSEQSDAALLLTEDLNHGQMIAGVRIANPFHD